MKMALTKKEARNFESLYRIRVKWIKENIIKATWGYQTCGYCTVGSFGVDCHLCPAYDHVLGKHCMFNDLAKTRFYIENSTKKAKQHLKTTHRLYRQWCKRYGHLLKENEQEEQWLGNR